MNGKPSLFRMLERLKESKEQEIEEYVRSTVESNPNFYVGYGAMIRKDLEQAYLEKEKQIQDEIDNFDKFYTVDVREMVEVKEEVRKNLIAERKRLNNSLEEMKLSFDSIMNRLSNFKYIYDENHIVQNGSEYKKLFDESHVLIDNKNGIEKQLKQIEEYLSLTELTSKEIETLMRSMNPIEKQEYDRRKGLTNISVVQEPVVEENISELTDDSEEVIEENPSELTGDSEEVIEENTPIVLNKDEELTSEEIMQQSAVQLLDEVYSDIVSYARKLRYMDVNNLPEEEKEIIQLPTGMYLNESDLNKAIRKYYRKNKGKTYRIEGINKEFTVTRDSVKRLKEALKKCSAVKLVRDKKLGSYDLTRVFGREQVSEIENIAKNPEEIMTDRKIEIGMPTGWYINGEEFIQKLTLLFETKKQSWIEKLSSKLKSKKQRKYVEEDYGFYSEDELEFEEELFDQEIEQPVKTR